MTNLYRIGLSNTTTLKAIDVSNLKKLDVTDSLAKSLNIPIFILDIYNNWVEIDGDVYYYKKTRSADKITKELLGEYISKYMDLETVTYILARDRDGISGLLSENYRESDIEYVQSYQLTSKELAHILRTINIPIFSRDKELEEALAKYIMRNFYTASGDRDGNVLCQRVNDKVYLAPLYDYECSFNMVYRERYTDKLFVLEDGNYFPIDIESIFRMVKKSKVMEYYYDRIMSFDMGGTLGMIEDDNGIIIPDKLKDELIDYDVRRKEYMYRKK